MIRLRDPGEVAKLRLRRQALAGAGMRTAAAVVGWLGAVQAQEFPMAKWGIAQRMDLRATDARLDEAFDKGIILRTHAMRPTWHFVTPADIGWLQGLTGPRVHRQSASIYRRLGLDERTRARSTALIVGALAGGRFRTRRELATELAAAGFATDTLALAYHVMSAELDGVICSGPQRGKQHTYALVTERAPQALGLKGAEAIAELCARFFSSHGPATLRDWGWWSGMTMGAARAGLAELGRDAEELEVAGVRYWLVERDGGPATGRTASAGGPLAHLLPAFDELFIGYRDREAGIDPRLQQVLGFDGSTLVNHLLSSSGRLIGGWRRVIEGEAVRVVPEPAVDLTLDERAGIQAAADRFGQFLGRPVVIDFG